MAFTTQDLPAEYRTYSRRDYEKRKEHLITESFTRRIQCSKYYSNSNFLLHTNGVALEEYRFFTHSHHGKVYIILDKEPAKKYISENIKKIDHEIRNEQNAFGKDFNKYISCAEQLKPELAQLDFNDIIVEFLNNESVQFTLSFADKKLLMIDKALEPSKSGFTDGQIIYSYFINRKLISSNVVEISEFVKKFQNYISM